VGNVNVYKKLLNKQSYLVFWLSQRASS